MLTHYYTACSPYNILVCGVGLAAMQAVFIELKQSYDKDIKCRYHRYQKSITEKQLKMKNTEKKKKKGFVQPDVLRRFFPANTGLISCCSTHQEVPKTYNNISGFTSAGI